MAAWAMATMASICVPVARSLTAASPITRRRIVECPTKNPAFFKGTRVESAVADYLATV